MKFNSNTPCPLDFALLTNRSNITNKLGKIKIEIIVPMKHPKGTTIKMSEVTELISAIIATTNVIRTIINPDIKVVAILLLLYRVLF